MTRGGGCRCPHGWLNRDGALACSSELTVTNGMKGDIDSSGPSLTIPVVNWDHAGQLQGSRKTSQQKVPGGRELSLRCQGPCWSFLNPPRLVSRQPEWQRPLFRRCQPVTRCELRPEQPQSIPISSVLGGTENESDLERTKRSPAAHRVHSWSHPPSKRSFRAHHCVPGFPRARAWRGGRAAVAPFDCPLSAGGCLFELGGSQSDASDQSVLAQETGGRLSSAGPWARRGREGLRTRAGAHREKTAQFEGAPWGLGPRNCLWPRCRPPLLVRLAVRGVTRKAAGARSASTAAPARSGQPRPLLPEAPPIRKCAVPNTRNCGAGLLGVGKADGERAEAQDARTGPLRSESPSAGAASARGALVLASGGVSRRG